MVKVIVKNWTVLLNLRVSRPSSRGSNTSSKVCVPMLLIWYRPLTLYLMISATETILSMVSPIDLRVTVVALRSLNCERT